MVVVPRRHGLSFRQRTNCAVLVSRSIDRHQWWKAAAADGPSAAVLNLAVGGPPGCDGEILLSIDTFAVDAAPIVGRCGPPLRVRAALRREG